MPECAVLKIPDVYGELTFSHPEGSWMGDGKGTCRPATLENSKVLFGNFSGSTCSMTQAPFTKKTHLSLVPDKTENQDSTKVLPLFSKDSYRTFSSQELDPETGLYYFGARYYDPRTSVWQSADPAFGKYLPTSGDKVSLGFQAQPDWYFTLNLPGHGGIYNSPNLGLYTYTRNNPLRLVDPNGRLVIEDDVVVSAVGAGLGIVGQGVEDLVAWKYSGLGQYAGSALGGAADLDVAWNATILSGGNPLVGEVSGGAAGGYIDSILSQSIGTGKVDWGKVASDATLNVAGGAVFHLKALAKLTELVGGLGKELATKGEEGLLKYLHTDKAIGAFAARESTKELPATVSQSLVKGAHERETSSQQNTNSQDQKKSSSDE